MEGESVESAFTNLQDRIRALEGPPITKTPTPSPIPAQTPIPPITSIPTEDFFRMDNPWMWITFVAIAAALFGIWWFLGKSKKKNEESEEEEEEVRQYPQQHQSTPREEYARHYGMIQ